MAAFYDNIRYQQLAWALGDIGCSAELSERVLRMLRTWFAVRGCGIPQGGYPSDLLAKIYLNPVDVQLGQVGIDHVRYSDDFRIFCASEREAKSALMILTRELRNVGLDLQTAKSRIMTSAEFERKATKINHIISNVKDDVAAELAERYGGMQFGYASAGALRALFNRLDPGLLDVSTLRIAFRDHIKNADPEEFDKSLFHYLINRLGAIEDHYAIEYCFEQLPLRAEETVFILRHFSDFKGRKPEFAHRLADMLAGHQLPYAYQAYRVVEWLFHTGPYGEEVNAKVASILGDGALPFYLRELVMAHASRFGPAAAANQLANSFHSLSVQEQVTVAGALDCLPKSRIGGLRGRWGALGPPVSWATKHKFR